MPKERVRILLTGLPGCGKTTAVRKIASLLGKTGIVGFYTEEIREGDTRRGFRWQRLDGRTGILAHVDIKGRPRVGKYGVDVGDFDEHVVPVLDPQATDAELFVIDEIGRMECFSERFVAAVQRLLKSDKSILATVALKGAGLIQEVKHYPAVELLHLTRENRDEITQRAARALAASMG